MAQPRNFGFGDEEQMIRDSAARLFKDRAGIDLDSCFPPSPPVAG